MKGSASLTLEIDRLLICMFYCDSDGLFCYNIFIPASERILFINKSSSVMDPGLIACMSRILALPVYKMIFFQILATLSDIKRKLDQIYHRDSWWLVLQWMVENNLDIYSFRLKYLEDLSDTIITPRNLDLETPWEAAHNISNTGSKFHGVSSR